MYLTPRGFGTNLLGYVFQLRLLCGKNAEENVLGGKYYSPFNRYFKYYFDSIEHLWDISFSVQMENTCNTSRTFENHRIITFNRSHSGGTFLLFSSLCYWISLLQWINNKILIEVTYNMLNNYFFLFDSYLSSHFTPFG